MAGKKTPTQPVTAVSAILRDAHAQAMAKGILDRRNGAFVDDLLKPMEDAVQRPIQIEQGDARELVAYAIARATAVIRSAEQPLSADQQKIAHIATAAREILREFNAGLPPRVERELSRHFNREGASLVRNTPQRRIHEADDEWIELRGLPNMSGMRATVECLARLDASFDRVVLRAKAQREELGNLIVGPLAETFGCLFAERASASRSSPFARFVQFIMANCEPPLSVSGETVKAAIQRNAGQGVCKQ